MTVTKFLSMHLNEYYSTGMNVTKRNPRYPSKEMVVSAVQIQTILQKLTNKFKDEQNRAIVELISYLQALLFAFLGVLVILNLFAMPLLVVRINLKFQIAKLHVQLVPSRGFDSNPLINSKLNQIAA